ncbi:MAG: restriction endonuclease [Geminicoccaceae bacterium]
MIEVVVATLILLLTIWGVARQRARERALGRFDALVAEHLPALRRKRRQLLRPDDYGLVDPSRWEREAGYFLDRVVPASLTGRDAAVVREDRARFRARLETALATQEPDASARERFAGVRTGQEFEYFCARELERAGWRVALTEATGDQGADLVAERGPDRLVVQCKLLGRPVGNGAVQEVAAARSHRQGNRALVVSNQRFTASCTELAAANGVELLHWSELARL